MEVLLMSLPLKRQLANDEMWDLMLIYRAVRGNGGNRGNGIILIFQQTSPMERLHHASAENIISA